MWVSLAALVVITSVGTALYTPQTASADEPPTCSIEKMGWIICPVIETAAKATDNAYEYMATWFLETPPELFNNASPTKGAWEQARNLANVAFVLALIILIYSQITGGLMSNYGIKRMLPRLIIAAVAVNISYYICQGMVDLSNIMGYNLKDALDDLSKDLPKVLGSGNGVIDNNTSGGVVGGLTGMSVTALALVGGLVWGIVAIMTGSIGVVLAAIMFILVILLLRKAFIVLLIVVSPLAFVAYLLPNTEKYYKQWMSMFSHLLLLFPITSLLMGMGQLASGIVLNAGVQGHQGATAQTSQCPTTASGQLVCDANRAQTANSGVGFDTQFADLRAQNHGVQLALAGCNGNVTATGQPCGDAQFDTGHGSASLGLGFAAAIIAMSPGFLVIKVTRESFNGLGKFGAELSGTLQKGTGAVGKGVGSAVKSGIGANKYGAAAQLSWQKRKENREHAHVNRAVDGLTGNAAGRVIANTMSATIGNPSGAKGGARTVSAAAEAAHKLHEQANHEREALELHEMNHGRSGESEHEFLKKRFKEAVKNDDEVGMNAIASMLNARGKDGQMAHNDAIEELLADTSVGGGASHVYGSAYELHAKHFIQHHADRMNTDSGNFMFNLARSAGVKQMKDINQAGFTPAGYAGSGTDGLSVKRMGSLAETHSSLNAQQALAQYRDNGMNSGVTSQLNKTVDVARDDGTIIQMKLGDAAKRGETVVSGTRGDQL